MLAFIILLVLAVVGADSTSAAPSITGAASTNESTADRRASSDSAAPALDPSSRRANTTTDEKLDIDDNVADVLNEDGCFTILSIIVQHLPALERSLAELSDVTLPQKLPYPSVMVKKMLKLIQELVDYMEFIRQSVDNYVKGNPSTDYDRRRRIVTNEALHRIGQATTLIKKTIGRTTADATAMEAMQTILSSMLSLNEYLLAVDIHEQNHHHSGTNSTTLEEEMVMDEEEGSGDPWPLPDAEEKVLARFHRTDPTNKLTAFLHAIGNPRAHTQAECCFDDCHFNDCCLDCCKCCPECSYPPAGDKPPVIPPAA